jgi:hypothetical protein
MNDFRKQCFTNALRGLLTHRFLSLDFANEPDAMQRAIVSDTVNEIVNMVEINFEQE